MENFNLYATLRATPSEHHATNDLIYITRGASAELVYKLYDKAYMSIDTIDQATFTFKQGKSLFWYSMFNYLVKSTDSQVIEGKEYYTEITPLVEGSLQCTATKVVSSEGNPAELGYYELSTDPKASWKTHVYFIDPHFYIFDDPAYSSIILNLSSVETKQFKANVEMEYEVALRLNTDVFEATNYTDSIIIEPQHSIAVIDSLYSRI